MRATFKRTRVGIEGEIAWEVRIGGNLFAVVTDEQPEVHLVHGFEHPFVCVRCSWASLDDCKAEMRRLACLFGSGLTPETVDRLYHPELYTYALPAGITLSKFTGDKA